MGEKFAWAAPTAAAVFVLSLLGGCRKPETRPSPASIASNAQRQKGAEAVSSGSAGEGAAPGLGANADWTHPSWAPRPLDPSLSDELLDIISQLEGVDRVESATLGVAGTPSSQWERYERLEEIATVDQLIRLTDYDNATVRCYAFQALAAKNAVRVFEVLLRHVDDSESVSVQRGCIGMTELTGDYFINVVTRGANATGYHLSPAERERLDGILLNDHSVRLAERASVLHKLEPKPENYARVRQLASDEREGSAVRALARYQRQEDKDLIATFFKRETTEVAGLYAVREFPDESFYPLVTKIFEREWRKSLYDYPKWRLVYQVLAKYPSPQTLGLFDRTLKARDAFRHETLGGYLLLAITKYPNPSFEPLKSEIVLESQDEVRADLAYDD